MIPPRLQQIFDVPVSLSSKDAQRLSPYLGHWEKLHGFLALGVNESDLKRLITLELMNRRRKALLDRLLMRLGRVQRENLNAKILKEIHA